VDVGMDCVLLKRMHCLDTPYCMQYGRLMFLTAYSNIYHIVSLGSGLFERLRHNIVKLFGLHTCRRDVQAFTPVSQVRNSVQFKRFTHRNIKVCTFVHSIPLQFNPVIGTKWRQFSPTSSLNHIKYFPERIRAI
jgi:hypothetical protein